MQLHLPALASLHCLHQPVAYNCKSLSQVILTSFFSSSFENIFINSSCAASQSATFAFALCCSFLALRMISCGAPPST
ncbi:hypothetical protein FGO68_gene13846 [Halteria grandinella]|uniref:Uncharacterized protein n=1 Tax=Halteria grandinella TaxID=5974 RepID=A0A8J8T1Q9_HALGN|nr:hypothetical protein FGO68_gene13846 [Halteria grandinella]